ncbi:hypothetical protein N9W41_00460 [bacterium]|nr:hypothetical protein [bacterium]
MKVLDLLNSKNVLLEKFYSVNESKIIELDDGVVDKIEEFYTSREGLLSDIHKIDSEIQANNRNDLEGEIVEASVKKKILDAISFKNEIVQRILAQDLQILSYIEKEKSDIIKQLKETKVVKKVFSSYKHSSNKIKSVNEEA